MRVLQINAVYEKFSTGKLVKELHETMLAEKIESFVAAQDLAGYTENSYQIGNRIDWKYHSLMSRVSGKQGYFSKHATRKLLHDINTIMPDIIVLHNLHGNYLNIPMLFDFIVEHNIATVAILHDCWFYTGKCMYYIQHNCERWLHKCGDCPALHTGNPSFFFDRSTESLLEKKEFFSKIKKLAVIGVSQWVTDDARKSILKNAYTIRCIYNWIDLQVFRPFNCDELRQKLNLNNKFVILGVAMIWNTQKGLDVFNKLADMLSDNCQIILVGGGAT